MTTPLSAGALCRIIEFPKIKDPRGNLTFIEGNNQIPFDMRRTFWIYDVPGGEMRGGHAYIRNHEIIIAVSGSFTVEVDDGDDTFSFLLNRSYYGLYIPPLHWRTLTNFSTNSLCLVLASEDYSENDYLRDFEEYKKLRAGL